MEQYVEQESSADKQPVLVEAGNLAIELENITDDVKRLTAGYETPPPNHWLRQRKFDLPNGTIVVLAYTEGHPDGQEFAAVVEEQPLKFRNINRSWNHRDSSDKNKQEVTYRAKESGRQYWEIKDRRFGFTNKDINRLNKLVLASKELAETTNG
jgi:hypothetical protein